jgi:PAS domain S-box-containing protein
MGSGKDDSALEARSMLRPRIAAAWRSLNRLRHGIGLRLLVSVLLFSSAVTLVLTLLQLYRDYRNDVGAIEGRMSEIEGSYSQSLGEGLWTLDRRQIELQIEGILALPAIRFVEVRETTGRADPMVVAAGRREAHAAVTYQFPLYRTSQGNRQQLGVVSIEATFEEVYRALLDKAIVILVSQGAKTFLVSFFILYILHWLVTRHLTRIAEFVGRYDLRHPPPPLRLLRRPPKEKDELDQVVAAFESMRRSLERAYGDLRESEQRFRDYAETESDWFWATGPEHEFTYLSEAIYRFDWEEGSSIGKRRWDFAADVESEPEKWREHRAVLDRHASFRDFVYTVRGSDGTPRFLSVSGKPFFDADGRFLGYRGVARDITQRKRAEEELRASEQRYHAVQMELAHVNRVTTMGQMTASIAHEVSQPIAATVANAEAGLRWLAAEPANLGEAHEALGRIIKDGKRAGDVVGRIRALIKKVPPRKDRLDVNEIILEVVALARSELLRNGVSVHTSLAEGLPPVDGDRIQLQQVILNLIINAVEAMGSVVEGTRELRITTASEASGNVRVAVQDSGPGLDSDSHDRLFDAFYTTKPGGMGMGLSICRSIIEAHGGKIWATANMPQGAIFQFTLPASPEADSRPLGAER